MSDYCVVVADGARARVFSLEPPTGADFGPNLVEREDLANAEMEAAGREVWSNDKSGRNISSGGGGAHGYDDHRQRHREETERRFAKQIAEAALSAAGGMAARQLVLAAEKQMLGYLRDAVVVPQGAGFELVEVAKDLTKLAPQALHEHLAADLVLPGRM